MASKDGSRLVATVAHFEMVASYPTLASVAFWTALLHGSR